MNKEIREQLAELFNIDIKDISPEINTSDERLKSKILNFMTTNRKLESKLKKAEKQLKLHLCVLPDEVVRDIAKKVMYTLLNSPDSTMAIQVILYAILQPILVFRLSKLLPGQLSSKLQSGQYTLVEDSLDEVIAAVETLDGIFYDIELVRNRNDNLVFRVYPTIQLNMHLKHLLDIECFIPPSTVPLRDHTRESAKRYAVLKPMRIPELQDTGKKDHVALNILRNIGFTLDTRLISEEQGNAEFKKAISRYIKHKTWTQVIKKYSQEKEFFFDVKYDKRGRSYFVGYQLNPQGTPESKAILDFSKKVKLTHNDLDAIVLNIVGEMDSSLTFEERIKFFKEHRDIVEESGKSNIKIRKGLYIYSQLLEKGELDTGYTIALDATGSGIQIMGAIADCETTCINSNIIDGGKLYKQYKLLQQRMEKDLNYKMPEYKIGKTSMTGLDRVKKSGMTHFYNSVKVPETHLTVEEAAVFYKNIFELFPGAAQVQEAINNAYQAGKVKTEWDIGDNHQCSLIEEEARTITIENWHGVNLDFNFTVPCVTSESTSLAPNVIHSIDGWIARYMVTEAHKLGYDLIHNHDCFIFSPKYLKQTVKLYKLAILEVRDSKMLDKILSGISGTPTTFISGNPKIERDRFMNSEFAIS